MQMASKEYIESMKLPFRNRGYVKVSIGVVNSDAQNNAKVTNTELLYLANKEKPFDGYDVNKIYATCEQNFSKVDGTMYFPPRKDSGLEIYNNGIITNEILGSAKIEFTDKSGLDIKGITIDFGHCYPTEFTIETNLTTRIYKNSSEKFVTEDSFDGTNYFWIKPKTMVNGKGRLRIGNMIFGIANTFTNEKVMGCSMKEYVSPISESIPSMDVSIKVYNQDLYYSVDNPESAIAYMEIGQEVKVTFGYDVTGNGDIEWLNETTTYLNSWSANDTEAVFTSTDRFYQLRDNFYGGKYRKDGISLYDLALEVLESAGITDEREYYIDPYLKKIIVYNPLPVVSHAEALQIIANAGRCALREDRKNKIILRSSFVPNMIAETNDIANFGKIDNILKESKKDAYANASKDFSVVDGSLYFLPKDNNYLNTGYVSDSVSDGNGIFQKNPKITVNLESSFDAYGLIINFRNTAPEEFKIVTYNNGVLKEEFIVKKPDISFLTDHVFLEFNKMVIEVTKGYSNSRLFIDNILINDVTDYRLDRVRDLIKNPTGTRYEKIKNIVITRENYKESTGAIEELIQETVSFESDSEYTIYFNRPSYGFKVSVPENPELKVSIVDSSDFYIKVRITNIKAKTDVKVKVEGYEYLTEENNYIVNHNVNGQEITWNNPLISTIQHAKDLEEWIAEYYLGNIDYEISWRGDPRTEANDLFYMELKGREDALIRSYQNEISFNGAWSGNMKARKVEMSWR